MERLTGAYALFTRYDATDATPRTRPPASTAALPARDMITSWVFGMTESVLMCASSTPLFRLCLRLKQMI